MVFHFSHPQENPWGDIAASSSGGATLGFMRNTCGKIETIFSPSCQFNSDFIEGANYGRFRNRQVYLQPAEIYNTGEFHIQKSEYWKFLPADVQKQFDQGNIFVTSGKDIYEEISPEIFSCVQETEKQISTLIAETYKAQFYMLHYAATLDHPSSGRGSFLVQISDSGQIIPVTVQVGNQEYIIELKGSGHKSGGFGEQHVREDGTVGISGGATQKQAKREFDNLEKLDGDSNYKIAGTVSFKGKSGFSQAYIIRLAPSSMRSSFSNNVSLQDAQGDKNIEILMKAYATNLVKMVVGDFPRMVEPDSWHLENLSASLDGLEFTDFSDHIPLGDNSIPNINRYQPVETMYFGFFRYLNQMRNHVSRLKGVELKAHWPIFMKAIRTSLNSYGIEMSDREDCSYDDFVKVFFTDVYARIIWQSRIKSGYKPAAFADYLYVDDGTGGNTVGKLKKHFKLVLDEVEKILQSFRDCVEENLEDTLDRALNLQFLDNFLEDIRQKKIFDITVGDKKDELGKFMFRIITDLREKGIHVKNLDGLEDFVETYSGQGAFREKYQIIQDFLREEHDMLAVMGEFQEQISKEERDIFYRMLQKYSIVSQSVDQIFDDPEKIAEIFGDKEKLLKMFNFYS